MVIPPPSKGGFFLRIGRGEFFWDGDQPKGLFLEWHGRQKFGCFSR